MRHSKRSQKLRKVRVLFFGTFLIAHFCCPEVAQRMSKKCPKGVQMLFKSCPQPVQKLPQTCPKVTQKLSKCCPKVVQKLCSNVVQMLYKKCPNVDGKWPRDINIEMVTKVVPVRAVNLSIGAFWIEFRCEYLCDNDTFWDRGQIWGPRT